MTVSHTAGESMTQPPYMAVMAAWELLNDSSPTVLLTATSVNKNCTLRFLTASVVKCFEGSVIKYISFESTD